MSLFAVPAYDAIITLFIALGILKYLIGEKESKGFRIIIVGSVICLFALMFPGLVTSQVLGLGLDQASIRTSSAFLPLRILYAIGYVVIVIGGIRLIFEQLSKGLVSKRRHP